MELQLQGEPCSGREGGTAGGAAPGRPGERERLWQGQSLPSLCPVPPHPEKAELMEAWRRWVQLSYRPPLGRRMNARVHPDFALSTQRN